MAYELIIVEKPSVAKKMAEALADGKANQKREGTVSYFLLSHNKRDIVVACAVGHLYTVAEDSKKSNNWSYPSFDIKWDLSANVNKASDFTKKYANVIKKLAKDANEFTVATDYDIEGEVIGYNVIRFLCKQKDANRMKFSALTKQDLVKAYESKSNTLNWPQANAGVTRHELDWFYGINLSRALSTAIKKAGRFKILTSGRVQGPALKILCDKERSINKFNPEPYWELHLDGIINAQKLGAEYSNNPLKDENNAKELEGRLNNKTATISKVTKKQTKQMPPNPFDLTSIQVESYRLFKIQPKDTLAILQELYIGGWTSYPRTSSQKLPKELDYPKIWEQLKRSKSYSELAEDLLSKNKIKELTPNEGKKKDDAHPAIYPTGILPMNLEGRQLKVYDLVVKRFLATFGEPAIRENVKADILVDDEKFVSKGTRTVEANWHKYYQPYVKLEEIELPALKEGDVFEKYKIKKENKETKAPKRYTPASIIKELEKRNLGTKATRAQILENLFDRGYLNSKSIQVTEIGLKTCDVLEKYCPEILDEKLTRTIEEEMEEIRLGKREPEEVKDHSKKFLIKTLDNFKEKELEIGKALLDANLNADSFGPCPNCEEGKMVLRKGKYGRFLACNKYPDCKTTLKLPVKGKISAVDQEEQEEGHFYINIQLPKKASQKVDLIIKEKSEDEREKVEGEGEPCDKCKTGKMVYKKGIYGAFLGCSNYPKCKNIKRIPKPEDKSNTSE